MTTALNPTPKRRNALKTRARILAAAQKCFSELGYSQAGIRDIGAMADVSSTMLLKYFGSKAGLYEAALIDAMKLEVLLTKEREGFGDYLAQIFVDRRHEITPQSMIALSTNDPEAREISARVTEEYVIAPFSRWLGSPDAHTRALEIFLLSTGFVLYTRQLPELFNKRGVDKKLAKWFSKTVQDIVDLSAK